jgi:2,4-diketo-3-deoxy-L-fuconate hydrolase
LGGEVRYLAYEEGGKRLMGVVVEDGALAPVCELDSFYGDLSAAIARATKAVQGVGRESLRSIESLRQVPPVPSSVRVFCLGLNYRSHADEAGQEAPSSPTVFLRAASTLACHQDEVAVPSCDHHLDWEGEMAVVVGKVLDGAEAEEAAASVFAYTCFNDLSARTLQFSSSQWTLGKNVDGTGPMGPVLVGADEVADPYDLAIETRVNGRTVQSDSTASMIFQIGPVLSYLSQVMRLMPGDLLVTGTPAGVGYTRNPPVFLKPGDEVEVEIEGLGILCNRIVGAPPSSRDLSSRSGPGRGA